MQDALASASQLNYSSYMSNKILIMSGTSEIAQELAKLFVSKRNTLLIHGRNQKKLDEVVRKLGKVEPDCKIIGLDTIDLIHPKLADLEHKDFESVYDAFYAKWFDDLVFHHGLPSHMIIAGGGSAGSASSTIELNTVSAIKCCENYIRKIREHAHNEKYKNKQFSIVYMNSFLGERPDLWENAVVYSQAKRCVKEYLNHIRENVGDINLCVQNAIIGPIDTQMLKGFYKKMNFDRMGPLERIFNQFSVMMLPLLTSSPEKAAADLKKGIEAHKSEFFVPGIFEYMPLLLDAIPNLIDFFVKGVLFCLIFVPYYRNGLFKTAKNVFMQLFK